MNINLDCDFIREMTNINDEVFNGNSCLTQSVTYSYCHRMLYDFFYNENCAFISRNKSTTWMKTRNPLLGGTSPNEMIEIGRAEKLLNFIESSIEENYLDESRLPSMFDDILKHEIQNMETRLCAKNSNATE